MIFNGGSEKEAEFYYRDPLAAVPAFFRSLVRGFGSLIYVFLLLADLLFLFPVDPQNPLFWLGLILALFLADRLVVRRGRADYSLEQFLKRKRRGNIGACFSPGARQALERAKDCSGRIGLPAGGLCLLSVLMGYDEIDNILSRLEVDEKKVAELVKEELKILPSAGHERNETGNADFTGELALAAFREAAALNQENVGVDDLFLGLFARPDPALARIFVAVNLNFSDVCNVIRIIKVKKFLGTWRVLPPSFIHFVTFFKGRRTIRHRMMNRAWTAKPTPVLDSLSTDYTDLAYAGAIGFLLGHDQEMETLMNVLARDVKNNVLLVGDPGSGKDTIVAHLAFLISRDNVPPKLFDKRVVALNVGDLVAGAETPGELQERVKIIVDEILSSNNIILYVPHFHDLTKTSGREYISAADILKPVLQASAFQVIGSTTGPDFRRSIEPRSDIASSFDVIRVEEIREDEAVQILSFEAILLERKSRIKVGYFAIKKAVELAHRYLRPKLLPSSADDLIKEAAEAVKKRGGKVIRDFDIVDIVSRKTRIPIKEVTGEEAESLLKLEEKIHRRLIDQKEAVKAVSSAIRQYRAGLARGKGPIASFLFIGPTGVGKTELAKSLAELYFGAEETMIRFDMSEYQSKSSIYRFTGSPEGESGGTLTEAVKNSPFSLILLDEFEKAHPDVLNLFLSVFDDGRLTDGLGNVIDFNNTIIIATSNAHSDLIKTELEEGRSIAEINETVKKRLTEYFRPELLNRFDDIIAFKPLAPEDIRQIAFLQVKSIVKQLAETKGINLFFSEEVVSKLAELGWDPVFGARPLRGVIREKIRNPIAEKILQKKLGRGSQVMIAAEDGEFTFMIK